MIEISTFDDSTQLRLSPNRSATWKQTKLLMLGFTCFVVSIAVAWTLVGAWVILPFAGLEVLALSLIMYLVSRATYQWEEVVINNHTIRITNSKGTQLVFQRFHTSLFYIEDIHNRRIPKLVFSTTQAKCEIGAFLNEKDKSLLQHHFSEAGIMVCKNKWWNG